jgi:hypothetical protein
MTFMPPKALLRTISVAATGALVAGVLFAPGAQAAPSLGRMVIETRKAGVIRPDAVLGSGLEGSSRPGNGAGGKGFHPYVVGKTPSRGRRWRRSPPSLMGT